MSLWLPPPPPQSRPCLACSGGELLMGYRKPSIHSICGSEIKLAGEGAAKGQASRRLHAVTAAATAPRTPAAAVSPRESHKIFDEVSIVVRRVPLPS